MRRIFPRGAWRLAVLAIVLAAAATGVAGGVTTPPLPEVRVARLQRGAGTLPANRSIAVQYDGTIDRELHLAKPHDYSHRITTRRILLSGPTRWRQDFSEWMPGDSVRRTTTTIVWDGRVLQRTGPTGPWTELTGRARHEAEAMIWGSLPVLAAARGAAAQGRGLEQGPMDDASTTFFWPESLGRVRIDLGVVDEPTLLTVTLDEPWRGSVEQPSRFVMDSTRSGIVWPTLLTTEGYPPGTVWRLDEHYVRIEDPAPDAVALPDSIVPLAIAVEDTVPRVAPLAKGVWAVELPDADTRSLVVEFANHLMVIEASSTPARGARLIETIRAHISRKPVRFVSFSHHHPDYTGGLRSFMADSATIVCAQSNLNYMQEIGRWPFTTTPDRLARVAPFGIRPVVDTLRAGRWRHADAANEVVAIDIGARSNHTDAYVLFWLPRAKLLYEGDLGFFMRDGKLAASSRAAGLLAAVDAAGIKPLTVVQGWPVSGTPRTLPMARLRALAAGRSGR